MIDDRGIIESVNPAVERMFGYNAGELLGSNVSVLMPTPDRERHDSYLEEYHRTGAARIIGIGREVHGRRKDGSIFPLELAVSEMQLAGRRAYAGFLHDTSKRKAAEEQAHQHARQQAAVAALGMRALAERDIPALVREAVQIAAQTLNVEFAKVLRVLPDGQGLLLEAGVGWQPGLVGGAVVPAGRHSQAGFTLLSREPVIVTDLASESRFNSPTLLRQHGVVSGMSVIIHDLSQPYGVFGVHTSQPRSFSADDVHFLQSVANTLAIAIERARADEATRQTEIRFRELADSAPVLIWVNGLEGCEFVNRAYREFLGIADDSEVQRFNWARFVHPDDRAAYIGSYLACFARRSPFHAQFRFLRSDGEYRWMKSSALPRFTAINEFQGYGGSTVDIDDVKRAEAALRESE
ncbi:MAG: PAS domain S-box protein [Chthoniobacteraceae bacterium]